MSVSLALQNNSARVQSKSFTSGSLLPLEVNSLWIIERGIVRIFTLHEDGTLVTLGLWGAGDVVGKALSKLEPYYIECLTNVEVIPLPLDKCDQIIQILFTHIQEVEELMLIRGCKTVDIMVIKLLAFLGKKFGRKVEQGRLIDLRLTHQDIAEMVGSTRVTITRVLTHLEQQSLIQRLRVHRILLREQKIWNSEI
jgi:CRP-like cAMP-binding protein